MIKPLKKIKSALTNRFGSKKPDIVSATDYGLAPQSIHKNARIVLEGLHEAGFQAYVVGGGVRDQLLNLAPKDFDVTTNAHPETIKGLFKRAIIIGKRFRLVLVHFYRDTVEVATFRGQHSQKQTPMSDEGMLLRDNNYTANLREDAFRRDFTVNALYYDMANHTIIDYTKGLADLDKKIIRLIGLPKTRYQEDPVRMLRAVRLASKLQFSIEKEAAKAILKQHNLLAKIPPARLFDEYTKIFMTGHSHDVFDQLIEFQLLQYMFPETDKMVRHDRHDKNCKLIDTALKNTDKRIAEGKKVTPAFLLSVFLWGPFLQRVKAYQQNKLPFHVAKEKAFSATIREQAQHIATPGRYTRMVKDIWFLQSRMIARRPRAIKGILSHPKFRASYDFMCLRHASGEPLKREVDWWTDIQTQSPDEQEAMIATLRTSKPRRPKKNANSK